MFSIQKFWQDCHGGLSPSIAIIMMYLITVCGMGANAAYLMTQKARLEGVADVIALEARAVFAKQIAIWMVCVGMP